MSNVELKLEQKKEMCLTTLAKIKAVFEQDYQQALANLESQVKKVAPQKTGRNWLGFILSILLKIFIWEDAPVYLPEKREGMNADELLSKCKGETDHAYSAIFKLLDAIAGKVQKSEVFTDICYKELEAVTGCEVTIVKAIRNMSDKMCLVVTMDAEKFLDSLGKDTADQVALRTLVRSVLEPEETA